MTPILLMTVIIIRNNNNQWNVTILFREMDVNRKFMILIKKIWIAHIFTFDLSIYTKSRKGSRAGNKIEEKKN